MHSSNQPPPYQVCSLGLGNNHHCGANLGCGEPVGDQTTPQRYCLRLRVRHMNEVRRRPESQLLILGFCLQKGNGLEIFRPSPSRKMKNKQIVYMDMGLISWQHSSVVTQATSEEDTDRSTVSTVTCRTRDNDHQKPVIQHQQVCF